jgi:hypothetical protein
MNDDVVCPSCDSRMANLYEHRGHPVIWKLLVKSFERCCVCLGTTDSPDIGGGG